MFDVLHAYRLMPLLLMSPIPHAYGAYAAREHTQQRSVYALRMRRYAAQQKRGARYTRVMCA